MFLGRLQIKTFICRNTIMSPRASQLSMIPALYHRMTFPLPNSWTISENHHMDPPALVISFMDIYLSLHPSRFVLWEGPQERTDSTTSQGYDELVDAKQWSGFSTELVYESPIASDLYTVLSVYRKGRPPMTEIWRKKEDDLIKKRNQEFYFSFLLRYD